MGISLEDTQKKLDKALKRNLAVQVKPSSPPTKIAEPEISEAEPIPETEE